MRLYQILWSKPLDKCRNIKHFFVREIQWEPSDAQLESVSRNKTFFMAIFYEYALCTLIIGFVLQPLLKFANPVYAFITGILLAASVRKVYRINVLNTVFPRQKNWRSVITMLVLATSFSVMAGVLLCSAFFNSLAHDEFCLSLQNKIQKEIDSEKNSSIFNNMQCRIQLTDDDMNVAARWIINKIL